MNFLIAFFILFGIEVILLIAYWTLDYFNWSNKVDYMCLAELMVCIHDAIKILGLVLILVGSGALVFEFFALLI